MIKFITGAAGSGKSTEMMQRIAKYADAQKEICIIVPEQFSYEFDKNLYHKIGAAKFNNLFSLSFTALARQLFQTYGENKRSGVYADELARMILIFQAISSIQKTPESLNYFRKQSNHSGFAENMLDIIIEMKRSGITPQTLMEKSVFLDKKLMDKTNDIALLYLEYEKSLSTYGFKDNFDDIKEAARIANANNYFQNKTVFIDEFESFTGDQLEFLKVIISSAEDVCITLRTDDVNAGEFTLFETVNNTYRKIISICHEKNKKYENIVCSGNYRFQNRDIEYLSTHILRSVNSEKREIPTANNIKIFESKDFYGEAEYVCATIKRLIYNNSTIGYKDIAVISNNINEYAEVLEAAFERYDIPFFLSIEKSVMHTSIMIFFSTLLDIITSQRYNTELIFRFLKCNLLNISIREISMLENYCYKWSVDGDIWRSEFTAVDENIEQLEQLREAIIEPLDNLKKKTGRKVSASNICKNLYDFIVSCDAEKNISKIMIQLINENKDYEASEIKRLWSCLIDILDSISETIGDNIVTIFEVKKIVKSLIGRINYSIPPQTLDSVTAASARTARLNSPKIVFIMGVNDGDFPNTVNSHGVFSEIEKQKLSDNGIELSRSLTDIIASERLVVYKSLSAASEKIYITYPLSDLSGQSKYCAAIIDDIIKLFEDKKILQTDLQIKPDYYAVTIQSAYYHYMQDKKQNNTSISSIKQVLLENPEYKRKLAYVLSRSGQQRVYRISTDTMEQLKDFSPLKISPSNFELYNMCHFQYFCQECLRLFKCEKVDLDARYSGSIIHNCFYDVISSRSKESFLNLSYDDIEKEIVQAANNYKNEKMGGEFAKNPRFELSFNKLSEQLVKVLVHTQQELMASDFKPVAFEINLMDEKNYHPLQLPFKADKTLRFSGIIDRADVCSINGKNYLRIIDYKKSRKEIDPVTLSNGVNMQMLLYLFAVTEKNSLFSDYEPAGVLYSPVAIDSVEIENSKQETENTSTINSKLKTSGLILNDRNVLEAMEKNIEGKYIPAKLNKENNIDEKSSCLSPEGFEALKDYSYEKLIKMAEQVYNGDADANPLFFNDRNNPCNYCDYVNVCGNSPTTKHRDAKTTSTEEAEQILNLKKTEGN